MLDDSITNKLVKLPDATLVYPAHGAGSMCGKSLSKETFSTIGEQKVFNYALQPMSREEFKKIVTADQPEAPDSFVHDAILNRKERASLDDSMQRSLRPLTVDEVLVLRKKGAQLVDVRDGIDCEGGYWSAIAASLLPKLGVKDIHDMVGGYKAWMVAKLPTRA